LCYEEDLRQYNDYIVEYRKWEDENVHSGEVFHANIIKLKCKFFVIEYLLELFKRLVLFFQYLFAEIEKHE